jgi:hypothetical protein
MLRSSRTGPTKIGSLTRASAVIVGALVALFGVIAGPLLGVFATPASAATGSGYTAITPYRALGTASAGAPVVAGTPANVQITTTTAAPTTVPAGATAAVVNVTASAPTSAGYLELYPTGAAPASPTSNVNFVAGETVANLVTVPLSATGSLTVSNFAGTTAVDVDVEGYYSATGAGLYNPVSPVRVAGTAAAGIPVAANTAVPVTVTGGTIPASATAVVVNLTAVGGTSASYLSAYAAGATPATTSSLNFTAGETVANRDVVNVGTGGQIEVYNFAGSVNVDVDVDGYYGPTGSTFTPLAAPVRVTDTRVPTNGSAITSGGTETFELSTTASGIPTTATAVAANFTVVPGAAPGYITVFPTGVTTAPTASDVNWPASSGPVANFTQADTAGTTAGSVQVYNLDSGSPVNLVIDAFGYFGTGTTSTSVGAAALTLAGTGGPFTVAGTAIPANGADTETLAVTVDSTATGHAPVVGDTVSFGVSPATGTGTLAAPTEVTNSSGVATDTYTAPANSTSLAGTATISVQDADYAQTGTITIAQTAPPSALTVSGTANVPANGTATDTVSVTVTPYTGETAAGDVVSFTADTHNVAHCGTAPASATVPTSTAAGTPATVTSTFTAGSVSALCYYAVSDTLHGAAEAIIDQTVSPSPAAGSLTVTTPASGTEAVTFGGSAVTVDFTALDHTGAVLATDPVDVTPSGDCGGATVGDETTNTSGVAAYSYTPPVVAGSTPGTCTLSAQEANTGATATATITQTEPTETVAISPTTGTAVPVGTSTGVTVTVTNDGATSPDTVTYTTSGTCGTLASATEPIPLTAGGGTSTSDAYTASGVTGFCTVTATTGTGGTASTVIDQTA